jgi:hypothetical protein
MECNAQQSALATATNAGCNVEKRSGQHLAVLDDLDTTFLLDNKES